MTFKMKAWKDVTNHNDTPYTIQVCCKKMSEQTVVEKNDDKWVAFCEDGDRIFDFIHCPFCGVKLP